MTTFIVHRRRGASEEREQVMIEVTIKLNETIIEGAVWEAYKQAFKAPEYGGRTGGAGWEEVKRQVADHIVTLDLSSMIAAAAKKSLVGVVEEVVDAALRAAVKQRAKEMRIGGTLFEVKQENEGER